jgi:hypothetical protein
MTTDAGGTSAHERPVMALGAEARCACKDRALSACPGEWEPGCDLGANEKYVQVFDEKDEHHGN